MTLEELMLRGVGSPSGAFTPTSLAGIEVWLDATDASTITDAGAGAVSQWDDKSGQDNHAYQSNATARPTTGTHTINSLNALDFTQVTTQFLHLTNDIISTGYTVFVVVAVDVDVAVDGVLGGSTAGAFSIRTNTTNTVRVFKQGDSTLVTSSTGLTTAGDVISVTSDPAGSEIWFNGVSEDTDVTDPGYTEALNRIGKSGGPSLEGRIGEVLVYNRALSSGERALVDDYLVDKWVP